MSHFRQKLGCLWGVKTLQILKKCFFWQKKGYFDFKLLRALFFFSKSQKTFLGNILGPYETSLANLGGPGGWKTPPNLTQNGCFWLKHDNLTL